MTENELSRMKTDIQNLKEDLIKLELDNNEFSILDKEMPDCFNLVESLGNGFIVFYMDERGNKTYKLELNSFKDAGEYLIALIKKMRY
jgi:hypothetical protein